MKFINKNELKINQTLFNFINEEVLPGTGIKQEDFWNRFVPEVSIHQNQNVFVQDIMEIKSTSEHLIESFNKHRILCGTIFYCVVRISFFVHHKLRK